jgi:short-subunit dehydrogenase
MPRRLRESVVVITGASSGIGRATALEFAERGATLVLAARREQALQEAARDVGRRGGHAVVVPTDVTKEADVEALARTAIERFGRIDVWVNNAAVSLFGRLDEVPIEDFRRVIETNVFGYVHGTRAALGYMREQGSGTIIFVNSVVADAPQPYTSAYVMSKSAIRALAECLRMELSLDDAADIHACTVMPASIDTPLFQQSANYTGREVKALAPTYPAETVARAIVRLARRPKREVVVGAAGRMMMTRHALAPGHYEKSAARHVESGHFQERPAAPSRGNLYEPIEQHASVSGGWESPRTSRFAVAALAGLALTVPAVLLARAQG